VRSTPRANYMWLYFDEVDSRIYFDSELSALKRGDETIASGVHPVRLFGDEAALYKTGSGTGGQR
jgi:hypothetical protein